MDYRYFKLIKMELEYTFLELIFVGGWSVMIDVDLLSFVTIKCKEKTPKLYYQIYIKSS